MKKMKLDTFMDFRMLSSLTLSPDGSRLAYVVTGIDREKKEYVSRLRLRTGDEDRAMVSDGKIGEFFFEDAEHILFATERRDEKKKEKDEEEKGASTVLYRLPLTGGEAEKAYELPLDADSFKLLPDGNLLMTGEISTENPDLYLLEGEKKKKALEKIGEEKDYEVLTESPFVYNGRGLIQGKRSALFLYQPKENRLRRLTEKYTDVGSFRVHGKDVYFSGVRFRNRCPNRDGLYHLDLETGKTEKLPVPRLIIYAIEFIGDTLVVIGAEGKRFGDNENPCFYTFDPGTGEFRLLCEADESLGYGMLTDVEYGASRFTKAEGDYLYFPALERDGCRIKRIGLDGVIETVAAGEGLISDYDVHGDRVFFAGMLNMKLPELYRAAEGNRCLTSWNAEVLQDVFVAQPNPITAELDGEEIDGWVLLPEDYDPQKKYPAVLDIHGGPKCAYGPVFFHEMQAWASKGYIVFFCNPHGSDGRGNAFSYLDLQWGSIDYRQIMAFTDKVLETYPAIDTKRMCCTGGSYGGYMSNWILGHTDRFCCIATQRSISNWVSMYGISDIPPISNFEVCSDDPYSEKGFAEMWDVSPLKYVRNAKTPTLIIHSEEDHRCPIAEGYQLYTALVYLRVPARMVVFHGENHELSRTGKPAHRLRRLEEIMGWFEKYTR